MENRICRFDCTLKYYALSGEKYSFVSTILEMILESWVLEVLTIINDEKSSWRHLAMVFFFSSQRE